MGPPLLGRLGLLGAAAIGVIVGHCLVYFLAVGDGPSRRALLTETGHGHWNLAIGTAVVLAFWTVGAMVLRCLRPGSRGSPKPAPMRPLPLVLRLMPLQAALFVAMEAVERLVVGASIEGMLDHGLLSIGLLLQGVTALAVALVLCLLARAVQALVAALRSPLPTTEAATISPPIGPAARPVAVLAGGIGVRGPPSLR